MSENMTVCADCGQTFETTDQVVEKPFHVLQQHCERCGDDVAVSILYYPDTSYEVIAPALIGDQCTTCADDAACRAQRTGGCVEHYCVEHMGLHRQEALSFRSEL